MPQIPRGGVVAKLQRTTGGEVSVRPDHAQMRHQIRRRLRQSRGEPVEDGDARQFRRHPDRRYRAQPGRLKQKPEQPPPSTICCYNFITFYTHILNTFLTYGRILLLSYLLLSYLVRSLSALHADIAF